MSLKRIVYAARAGLVILIETDNSVTGGYMTLELKLLISGTLFNSVLIICLFIQLRRLRKGTARHLAELWTRK
mgnify:CR=1 FL=1